MTPVRTRIRTVKGGPMGPDGKIVVKMPTVGEQRHNQKVLKSFEDGSDEQEEAANKYFADMVLDWNWVDDEGNDLPKPNRNPDVFGELTGDELQFVARCLAGITPEDEADRKK